MSFKFKTKKKTKKKTICNRQAPSLRMASTVSCFITVSLRGKQKREINLLINN